MGSISCRPLCSSFARIRLAPLLLLHPHLPIERERARILPTKMSNLAPKASPTTKYLYDRARFVSHCAVVAGEQKFPGVKKCPVSIPCLSYRGDRLQTCSAHSVLGASLSLISILWLQKSSSLSPQGCIGNLGLGQTSGRTDVSAAA